MKIPLTKKQLSPENFKLALFKKTLNQRIALLKTNHQIYIQIPSTSAYDNRS